MLNITRGKQIKTTMRYHLTLTAMIKRSTVHPAFMAAPFTIASTWKQPKCPSTEEWVKKMWGVCVYTHTHIGTQWNISHKKEQNNAFCCNMDGQRFSH